MVSIADIKGMIADGSIKPSEDGFISDGSITSSCGTEKQYKIFHGWDLARANICDQLWGSFNLELIEFVANQKYGHDELAEVMGQLHLEDKHWRWFNKSCLYSSDEYNWFFLDINGKPQAACLIHHPKKSVIQSDNIFYIEYVAAAPWNRPNPMADKDYSGVGSIIIKSAMDYAENPLGLRHGFSLHSLPKAKGFYEKIGMVSFTAHDKDELMFYEMPEEKANIYLDAS